MEPHDSQPRAQWAYSASDPSPRAYDRYAEERDRKGLDPRKLPYVQEAVRLFRANGTRSILEIGSGPGNAAEVFHDGGLDIECADVSPVMVDLVRSKGIRGHVIDCRQLRRLERTYDRVLSVNCLLHIPSQELPDVLEAISDVLNEKGLFVLGLWGGQDSEGVWEGDHYEPKRYFVLYSQQTPLSLLTQVLQIEEYRRFEFGEGQFFHKVVLRRTPRA